MNFSYHTLVFNSTTVEPKENSLQLVQEFQLLGEEKIVQCEKIILVKDDHIASEEVSVIKYSPSQKVPPGEWVLAETKHNSILQYQFETVLKNIEQLQNSSFFIKDLVARSITDAILGLKVSFEDVDATLHCNIVKDRFLSFYFYTSSDSWFQLKDERDSFLSPCLNELKNVLLSHKQVRLKRLFTEEETV